MNRSMSVSQLAKYLKGVFEDEELLHDVTLTGEVTDISYSDRHTFLVLAEGMYSVRCVHFLSRDGIEKGMRVSLKGSVNFYDKRNSVSFSYDEFYLQGIGDKNLKLDELKRKLCSLGYFENRPALPEYIVRVVAVTSPDGAAIRDFIRVVHDKNPFVDIKVYPVKVQGEGAAAQMAEAFTRLSDCGADAIVLCRGGGSDEDLDSFNDERLATAVALSKIPVISAVGHEINYTLCDFCAGTRAGTPSIAGEIVNMHAGKIADDIVSLGARLRYALAERYDREVKRLGRLGSSTMIAVSARVAGGYDKLGATVLRGMYAIKRKTEDRRAEIAVAAHRMRSSVDSRFADYRARSDKLGSMLGALNPHRIIKIGYAAVLRGGNRIKTAAELKRGDGIKLVFADGVATAEIKETRSGTELKKETL